MSTHRRAKKTRSALPVTVLTLLIVLALAGAAYLNWDLLIDKLGLAPGPETRPAWEEQLSTLEKEIASRQTDAVEPGIEETATPPEEEPQAGSTYSPVGREYNEEDELLQLSDKILAFFNHLDNQEYVAAYQLQEGSKTHFNQIVGQLFANPPVVTREVDDLFTILNNMSHFFRVIGKQNILLVKEILLRESEDVEPVMALFYRWSEIGHRYKGNEAMISLPLKDLYEYAGFFLNTLGGQSYLFRRGPRIRMLVKYYSILVIDRANKEKRNRHGIDIRFSIDSLINELEASQNLAYKDDYLKKLYALQSQYQTRHE